MSSFCDFPFKVQAQEDFTKNVLILKPWMKHLWNIEKVRGRKIMAIEKFVQVKDKRITAGMGRDLGERKYSLTLVCSKTQRALLCIAGGSCGSRKGLDIRWVALCILRYSPTSSSHVEVLTNKASQHRSPKCCYPGFMKEGEKRKVWKLRCLVSLCLWQCWKQFRSLPSLLAGKSTILMYFHVLTVRNWLWNPFLKRSGRRQKKSGFLLASFH